MVGLSCNGRAYIPPTAYATPRRISGGGDLRFARRSLSHTVPGPEWAASVISVARWGVRLCGVWTVSNKQLLSLLAISGLALEVIMPSKMPDSRTTKFMQIRVALSIFLRPNNSELNAKLGEVQNMHVRSLAFSTIMV